MVAPEGVTAPAATLAITGGVVSVAVPTVTVTTGEVAVLPAASRATAVSVWGPGDAGAAGIGGRDGALHVGRRAGRFERGHQRLIAGRGGEGEGRGGRPGGRLHPVLAGDVVAAARRTRRAQAFGEAAPRIHRQR